tara:strand:+ start:171 stop:368 length:198 start_codon:yes stop_codon:yes gene_type:complete
LKLNFFNLETMEYFGKNFTMRRVGGDSDADDDNDDDDMDGEKQEDRYPEVHYAVRLSRQESRIDI